MTDSADPTPRAARRTDTSGPRASRVRALKILFQADVRGISPDRVLEQLANDPAARAILDDVDMESLTAEGAVPAAAETDAGPATRTTAAITAAATRVPALDGFTATLVAGVSEHQVAIDELISRYARRWQISRMPVVDRTVLRLATYELLHQSTPAPVVLDEAVNLAKSMSTDDSGRYVNGVLESIRKDIANRVPAADDAPASDAPASDATPAADDAPASDDDPAFYDAVPEAGSADDEDGTT